MTHLFWELDRRFAITPGSPKREGGGGNVVGQGWCDQTTCCFPVGGGGGRQDRCRWGRDGVLAKKENRARAPEQDVGWRNLYRRCCTARDGCGQERRAACKEREGSVGNSGSRCCFDTQRWRGDVPRKGPGRFQIGEHSQLASACTCRNSTAMLARTATNDSGRGLIYDSHITCNN